MIGFETLIVILITVLCSTLGLVVLLKNIKARVNRSFFGLTIFLVLWIMSSYLETQSNSPLLTRLLIGFDYGSAPLIGLFFVFFSYSFPTEKKLSRKTNLNLSLIALIFSILCFSNLIVSGISGIGENISVRTGVLYIPYAIFTSIYVLIAIVRLINEHTKATGLKRKQTSNVLIGFFLTASIAVTTNLFLSRIIDPSLYKYGVYGVIFFISFTAYGIIRNKMLNIRMITTEVAVMLMIIVELIQTLLSTSYEEFGFRLFFLLIVLYTGSLLIKSVKQEIRQKDELANLADALEKANVKLEELDEAKDNFLSMASHELNTPIAAISGYLSMIIEEQMAGKLNAKMKSYLTNVFISSKRLAALVRDLLNVSRIESNRIHIIYSEGYIEDTIQQSISEVKIKADEVGHKLSFKKPAHKLPKFWFDQSRITEVIINFIGNAIKYTDPGGKIVVSAHADDKKIVVAVTDNGRGIPTDRSGHIFEKFAQVDVLKDQVKGTGLGMFISKNLIEMHKGKIWFKSSVDAADHGTTFYFSLPLIKEKPFDKFEGQGEVIKAKE